MGIMRPEIPESALRGQVQSGFWPSGCPSGVQVNLHFATRSTYRERHEEALYRFKDGWRPSDFFHHNVFLSFQEDEVGIRLRDIIGVDNMMWGSDYPHSESTFPQSRQILAQLLAGVPENECAKIVGGNTARLYHFDLERLASSSTGASGPITRP